MRAMRVCPKCNHENKPHYKFCLGCGALLPGEPAEDPGQPIRIQPVPAPPREQARCSYCGMRLPDASAVRCPHCSAPL
jgi:Double zinc ribbon